MVAGLTSELFQEFSGTSQPFSYDGHELEEKYVVRVDPLSGDISKISEARARMLSGLDVDLKIEPVKECVFCDFEQKTPTPRITHDGGAVTVPNLNPWERYDLVTIYPPFNKAQGHKLPTRFCFEDFGMMIRSHYDIAEFMHQKGVLAMYDFTNWGPHAGASQQHPHSQRKSITFVLDPRESRELGIAKEYYQATGRNIYDDYAAHEIGDGRRIIHNDGTFIAAEFAPKFEHGLILFPAYPAANILQTSDGDRKGLVAATGTIPGLVFYLGVTSFNMAVHQAPFDDMDEARKYFRWHMHIWPRRATIHSDRAGAEVGYDTNVVGTFPETTAAKIRAWYAEGPRPEYVAKDLQGNPSPNLVKELLTVTNRSQ